MELLEHFKAIMAFHVIKSVVCFNGLNASLGSRRAATNSIISFLLLCVVEVERSDGCACCDSWDSDESVRCGAAEVAD